MAESREKRRVVIVGAGFAGFNAARELSKLVGATTEIVVINSTDYFLYLPLMPQVSGGLIEPAHVLVSLPRRLRKTRFVLGTVNHVDSRQKVVSWEGPEGAAGQVRYDRLILTAGSVNKLLPIPGIADYAHGFRTIAEAGYLRDHIIRQLELASVAADSEERRSRCTFVVVGAGYTGTEVTAQGQLMTTRIAKQMPGLAGQQVRWMLLDTARGCWHSWIRGCRRRRPGAAAARGGGADGAVGHRGRRRIRAAIHRRESVHPIADLVCRGPRRPADGRPEPRYQRGAAGGR
jgi:NADH dehydrogenase